MRPQRGREIEHRVGEGRAGGVGVDVSMPSGSDVSASRACRRKVGDTSSAVMRAPRLASSRVLLPSPQPISRPRSPSTDGSMAKKAGVFTRSR